MFIDIDEFIDFLVRYKITPNQFMFCYLRHLYFTEDSGGKGGRGYQLFKKYSEGVKPFKMEEIKDLEAKGIVEDFNERGEDFMDSYLVVPTFIEKVFIETNQAEEELWNTYPAYLYIDGKRVSARSCDKEKILAMYVKKIKNSRKKHNEIIYLLKEAVSRNEVGMGIEKWILSEQWIALKDMYSNKEGESYGEREF